MKNIIKTFLSQREKIYEVLNGECDEHSWNVAFNICWDYNQNKYNYDNLHMCLFDYIENNLKNNGVDTNFVSIIDYLMEHDFNFKDELYNYIDANLESIDDINSGSSAGSKAINIIFNLVFINIEDKYKDE